MQQFIRLLTCKRGATAIEYGLIAATITVVMLGALTSAGSQTGETFDGIASQMSDATPG